MVLRVFGELCEKGGGWTNEQKYIEMPSMQMGIIDETS